MRFNRQLKAFRESDNPYAAEREFYLMQRQAEIDALHGKKPEANADGSGDAAGSTGAAKPAPH